MHCFISIFNSSSEKKETWPVGYHHVLYLIYKCWVLQDGKCVSYRSGLVSMPTSDRPATVFAHTSAAMQLHGHIADMYPIWDHI